ncbi:MAG: 3-isopropylmalate dehydratase small subunit [Proteobacteria bacterium]|nr:3-isopropylmalate dehydratase small subunit [Pseudomonadota bacterium]
MEKFTRLTGVAAPLMQPNIDTDAIVPSRFLTRTTKTGKSGFGEVLFADWRFDAGGSPKPDFVLNRPEYAAAKILLAAENFGCGSSREHAVWALLGFGIRCVIAPGFGEIFFNSSFINGLLPVVLDKEKVLALADAASANGGDMTVDLETQKVTGPDGTVHAFEIDAARREALLEGLDAIAVTLKREDEIAAFQDADRQNRPWIYL